jgi:6-phosphogluconolactonase (cycloisomerase 2 family)
MANDKDFIVKDAVEVGGSVKTTVGTVTSGSVGYSIASASYDNKSFSIGSEETVPYKIRFNNDGTKLFMLGVVSDKVHQYTLSTAFDISTASYDSVNFSVASQETDPYGLAFNNDGTKMYITGNTSDSIFQYSLSTGFDLSTASYDSVSLSVTSQDTIPTGITFNSTGSKLYMLGQTSDEVHQYSLSTVFDLSTASYDSVSFSIASQETSPMDMSFNSDGTKMYIIGSSSDAVFQYSLSTGFDISTASYDSISFNVNAQESNPRAVVLNNDGTKMYIVGSSQDTVFQYSTVLTTNTLGLSTGNYFNHTLTENTQFLLSNAGDVQSFQLEVTGGAVGYDLAGASYDSVDLTVSSQDSTPISITFKPDGTKLYMNGSSTVFQYTLSTAWDLSTASYENKSYNANTQLAGGGGAVAFKPDGTKMFILSNSGSYGDDVFRYSLSTAWDVSSASYDNNTVDVEAQETGTRSLALNSDGTKLFILGDSSGEVLVWTLSSAYDLSTASYDASEYLDTSGQDNSPKGMSFSSDGSKLFIMGNQTDKVHKYNLNTAFDLSTASYSNESLLVSSQDTAMRSVALKSDGTKMYTVGYTNDKIYQYSTATGATVTWPSSIEWPDGTAPLSPADGEKDLYTITTDDSGTTYKGVLSAYNLS